MTNDKLRQLAVDIGALIQSYGIEIEKYAVNVTITEDYYQEVKDTLQSDVPSELQVFTEVNQDWAITLIRPMKLGKLTDDTEE